MNVTFSQTIGNETLVAGIAEMPDGRHAAEITSTTKYYDEENPTVLWSRVFATDSIATITGALVRQWDHFVACRNGHRPDTRPQD